LVAEGVTFDWSWVDSVWMELIEIPGTTWFKLNKMGRLIKVSNQKAW